MNERIETSLNGNSKIELVGQSYVNTALLFLTGIALGGLLLQVLILMQLGAGLILFTTLSVFLIVFGLLLNNFWKSMATAYIRGEMVVVKYLNRDIRITELKHVKVCKSHKFLGFSFSSLKFRLDGKQHRVLLFGNPFAAKNCLATFQKAA